MAENFVDENETNLVLEASLRGYDMLDCLVVVNCSLLPPHIEVKRVDDYFGSHEQQRREYRSSLAMHPNGVGVIFIFGDGTNLAHTLVFSRDWHGIQTRVKDKLAEQLKSPAVIREKLLADVQKSYKL